MVMLGMFIGTVNEWKGFETAPEGLVLGWKSFVKGSKV